MQRDRTRQDTKGRDRTELNGTGWDGAVFDWVEFNSSVDFNIVLCMYVKFYYLLVTDIREKYDVAIQ